MSENITIYTTPRYHWFLLLLSVLLIGLLFHVELNSLFNTWYTREEYSHGFFIPVIAAFFIYQKKNQLITGKFHGSWSGILLVLFGLLVALTGKFANIHIIAQYALLLVVIGAFYTYIGISLCNKLFLSLIILFFMIPLPEFLYGTLSLKLQELSSYLGVLVIRFFDISVYLEGNVIDLGTYKLQVVEACSGLRYLFPLMCFGFICAYIFKAPFWQKLFIFFTTIPITVLMNSFRIGVIGILVNYWGIKHAEGFLHDFEGWIVFVACVAILFLEMWLLTYFFQKKSSLSEVFTIDLPAPITSDAIKTRKPVKQLFVLPLLLTTSAGFAYFYQDVESIFPERESFITYPDTIAEWEGRRSNLEKIYIDALSGLTDYLLADYRNPNGDVVNFYVAYYEDQSSAGSIHTPKNCIPGGGWRINDLREVSVFGNSQKSYELDVNRVVISLGDRKQLVYYWFYQIGREISDEYMLKWHMLSDALFKNRNDGALIRLTTLLKPGEDEVIADQRLQSFLKKSYPELKNHLPE